MAKEHKALFNTDHLRSGLKAHSLRGGFWTLTSHSSMFVLRIISVAVLARLLSPDDFGLLAMVLTLTAFADLFKDIGLSTATIQRQTITHEQISNLFWVNLVAGLLTMSAVLMLAPLMVRFYGDGRLLLVTALLSINFLFGGLTVQHQALLKRQMRFARVAIAEISAFALSLIIAIILAMRWRDTPMSHMALVYMSVARCFFLMVGMWLLCRWFPGLPGRGTGVRSMLRYGTHVTGFNLINYFARNLDRILIGRHCGAGPLGFYSKAYQFLLLPVQQFRIPLVSVAMPALSALQEQHEKYRWYVRKIIAMLAFVTMPLMAFLGVCADLVVRVFFGGQWEEAIPIFRVLSILGFVQPVAGMCGLVLLTLGKSKKYLYFGIMNSSLIAASFLLGIQKGAIGVACAYTVVSYVSLLPLWKYCFSGTPVSPSLFLRAIKLPAITSMLMGLILLFGRRFGGYTSPALVEMLGAAFVGVVLYIAFYSATEAGRAFIVACLSDAKLMLRQSA